MFWDENEFDESKTDALRRHSKGRSSRGMSLFVRKLPKPGYEIISSDSNHIWLKLKKEFFGDDEDLYICFVQVHPSGSPWQISNSSLNFEIIENETAKYQMLGKVMVIGDMNGRTNEVEDYIVNDSIDPYLPTPDDYYPDNKLKRRQNMDKSTLKGHGRPIIEYCRSTGLRIGNGRIGEDENIGKFTCINKKGASTVDYFLLEEHCFSLVQNFSVGDVSDLSNHVALSIILNCNYKTANTSDVITVIDKQECNPLINELISENIVKYKVEHDESENTVQCQDKEDLDNSFKELEQIIDKNNHSVESCVKHLSLVSIVFVRH